MNKELFIKDIIGKVLEPEGFFYIGRSKETSRFLRKVTNSKEETVKQWVTLQKNRYCKEILLNLGSSAAGQGWNYRIDDFIPDCIVEGLCYETEEEWKEVIEQFANILTQYGLPFLEKIKEPRMKYYITDKDYEMLFYHHEELVHHIIKREKVKIEGLDVEEVAEWIEKKIEEQKEKPFEEVRRLLLELSALFGAVANQYSPCEWYLSENYGCQLRFVNPKNRESTMSIVKTLFWEWDYLRSKEESNIVPEWEEWEQKKITKVDTAATAFDGHFMDFSNYDRLTLKEELLNDYKFCIQPERGIQP